MLQRAIELAQVNHSNLHTIVNITREIRPTVEGWDEERVL